MTDQPPSVEAVFSAARDAYLLGDFATAVSEAQRGLALVGDVPGEANDELRACGWMALAATHVEVGENDAALEYLRLVYTVYPDDGEAMYFEARARIDSWELAAAEELLRRCDVPPELRGAVTYHRAMAVELQERFDEVDELYERAASLDPEYCPRPVRMGEDEARDMLRGLVQSFPSDVRAVLDNATIEIVEVPDRKVDWTPHGGPLLLGLYLGVPIGERDQMSVGMPERVRIFKRNIERVASDLAELREQLRLTLLHEVGHHLGWDEDDLAERGLA